MDALLDALAVIDAAQDELFAETSSDSDENDTADDPDGLAVISSVTNLSLAGVHNTPVTDAPKPLLHSKYVFKGCDCVPAPHAPPDPAGQIIKDSGLIFNPLNASDARILQSDASSPSARRAQNVADVLNQRVDKDLETAISLHILRRAVSTRKAAQKLTLRCNLLSGVVIPAMIKTATNAKASFDDVYKELRGFNAEESAVRAGVEHVRDMGEDVLAHHASDAISEIQFGCHEDRERGNQIIQQWTDTYRGLAVAMNEMNAARQVVDDGIGQLLLVLPAQLISKQTV